MTVRATRFYAKVCLTGFTMCVIAMTIERMLTNGTNEFHTFSSYSC